jgi:DNA primase large subunit
LQNIFINNFPFSKAAAEHLKKLDIDIKTLPTQFPTSFNEAFKRLNNLIDGSIIPDKVDTSLTSSEVLIYAIIRVFIELINEDFLRNRFAEAFSKRTEKILQSESPKTIKNLAINTFNWDLAEEIHVSARTYEWKLQFNDFLEVAPDLMANDWKLINQEMHDGWVFLTKEKLIRIIAEKTKFYIAKRKIAREEIPKLPESYESYLNELKTKVNTIKTDLASQRVYSDEIKKSAYPPCLNFILKKAEKGENLAHPERLFLTFFLLNIETSIDDVLNVFKTQPDFNEEITRYQVEFAAGKRGSGTKYTSFGCPKLISYGLCQKRSDPEKWCQNGRVFKKTLKNPLQYYRAKAYLLDKEQKKMNKT